MVVSSRQSPEDWEGRRADRGPEEAASPEIPRLTQPFLQDNLLLKLLHHFAEVSLDQRRVSL